ncbi:GtrA family protein [Sphingobium sufflavum]|uniref:GtrA family protein n=1 Tax=Sphingobium sufflavum TaxID=1129547 RepID=UPI001F36FD58|nr:GtrA family protein [Sphingobium sufflavum]MCE7796810.1 GtrA family protein [Sphingobium sufflavum]
MAGAASGRERARMIDRAMVWQIARYGVVGGAVTAFQAAVYWALADRLGWHPQVANLAGYACAVVSGYVLHGAITFKGQDGGGQESGGGPMARMARFVAVSLLSLALNALWVWLMVAVLRYPVWSPIPLMGVVTPGIVFVLNRQWVFR